MRYSTELSQVEVIAVQVEVHISLLHSGDELIVISLSLAAADYLADTGNKEVNCCNGLAVGVLLHVEALDILGVIGNEYSLLEYLFGEVSLVLGLEVAAPVNGIYELFARLFQQFDSLGISNSAEFVADEFFKSCFQTLFKVCVKESYLIGALFKYGTDNVLYHILGYLDNVFQFCESYLGLNVPELSKVLGSVGVLCSERGSEGVYLAHCGSSHFALKLTGNGKSCSSAEEISCIVIVLGLVLVGVTYGCYAEHLACALTVRTCYQRSVDVNEVSFLIILMYSLCQYGTYPHNCVEGVCSAAEVGHCTQEFQCVTLLLERIILGAVTKQSDICGGNIYLGSVSAFNKCACNFQGTAHARDILIIGVISLVDNYLDIFQ